MYLFMFTVNAPPWGFISRRIENGDGDNQGDYNFPTYMYFHSLAIFFLESFFPFTLLLEIEPGMRKYCEEEE